MNQGSGTASGGLRMACAAVLALLIATATLYALPLNTDVGWFLFLAERVNAGEVLYVDRVEINLPWIVHLSRVPALLARWWDVSSVHVFRPLLFVAVLASVITISAPGKRDLRRPATWLIAAWLWLLLLWMPGSDIGEREHLFVLAFLPFVSLRSGGRDASVSTAVAVGLAAGIAVSLKPHFIPIWLAIEIERRWAGGRWFRPESLSVLLLLGLSVVLLPGLHPEYFSLLREYGALYGEFRRSSPVRLLRTESLTLLVVMVGLIACHRDPEFKAEARGFLVAAVAALLVAAGQQKGFTYHLYPAHVFAGYALLLLVLRFDPASAGRETGRALPALLVGALCLQLVWAGDLHRWNGPRDSRALASDADRLQGLADGGSVLILSIRMPDIFPLVNMAEASWASRYNAMWPVRSLYVDAAGPDGSVKVRAPAEMGRSERRFFSDVVSDLLRYRPRVLLVDEDVEPALGGRFGYLEFLAQDSAAARELSGYRRGDKRGRLRTYLRAEGQGAGS